MLSVEWEWRGREKMHISICYFQLLVFAFERTTGMEPQAGVWTRHQRSTQRRPSEGGQREGWARTRPGRTL